MEIKFLQWNIGGSMVRSPASDAKDFGTYTREDIGYISNTIKKFNIDIVTIQESHRDVSYDQVEQIAYDTGLDHFVHDSYDISHIDPSKQLGQGIISRFPITSHAFDLLTNPKIEFEMGGKRWITHDKGITRAEIELPNKVTCTVMTSHMVPFRKLELDPLSDLARPIRNDFYAKSRKYSSHLLMASDYNIDGDTIEAFIPDLFKDGVKEVPLPVATTPRGRKYDHILYKGFRLGRSMILVNALTDHYPVYAEFTL